MLEVAWAIVALVGVAGLGLVVPIRAGAVVYGVSALIAAGLAWIAVSTLIARPEPLSLSLPLHLAERPLVLRLDGLSALFMVIVDGLAVAASIFAIGYGRHDAAPRRVLPFYPLFLAGMNLVLLAADAYGFLIGWEVMSGATWALILAGHERPANRRAATVYFTMAGFGALSLLLGFGLVSGGGIGFDQITATAAVTPIAAAAAGLCFLVGTGSKAGLAPLHIWLPLAHPAAPSPVSALMSGAMTKVALYGLIRLMFLLLPPLGWGWGLGLMLVAAATAVIGGFFSVLQADLKSQLAFSTVENIGLIGIGLGLALACRDEAPLLATLALTAALFHAVNHALFKGALFLGAGAAVSAVGTGDFNALGGLARRMPWTGTLMLVAALAMAGLPPLNGFASEWLLIQAVLEGTRLDPWLLKLALPVAGAAAALAFGLAAAGAVRLFGIAFLGRPRSPAAAAAREVDGTMRIGLALPVGACMLTGLMPGRVLGLIEPVAASVTASGAGLYPVGFGGIAVASGNSYTPATLAAALALAGLVAIGLSRLLGSRVRRVPSWDCGWPDPGPATQISATGFSQPLRRAIGGTAFLWRERVVMPGPGEVAAARHVLLVRDLVWDLFYRPVLGALEAIGARLNELQFLSIRRNLAIMFGALILLLMLVAAWR